MAIAEVQKAHFNGTGASGKVVVTFTAPTSGNTLVVLITTESAGTDTFVTPAGWNAGRVQNEAALYWRVSNGTETSTDFTWSAGSVTVHAWGIELSGTHASAPFDSSGYNTFTTNTTATLTTDATAAVADEYAVGQVGMNGANGGSETASNSYTLLTTGNTRDIAASRTYSGNQGGAVTTDIGWLTTRVGRWIIGSFKPAIATPTNYTMDHIKANITFTGKSHTLDPHISGPVDLQYIAGPGFVHTLREHRTPY